MPRPIPSTLLCLLLGACSGASSPEPGRVERLALAWADGPPAVAPARLVRQLVPGVGGPWRLQGQGTSLAEVDGLACVRFEQGGGRVHVEARVEPASFNQVAVRGDFPGPHSLHLEVAAGQQRLARRLELDGEGASALFDLRELRRWTEPVDAITLSVRGPGCRILALDLLDLPLEAALPALESARQVDLSGQAREAIGLPSGRALLAQLVPSAGQRLELACGQPEFARSAGQALSLRVSLEAGEIRKRLHLPLDAELAAPTTWHSLSVPLDELAGRSVRVRFELEVTGEDAAAAALAWPLLVTPGG